MKFPKNFIWVVLILVVVLVAYAVVRQGQALKTINVGEKGISLEFDKLKEIPKDDLANRQNELERKLNDFKRDVRENPQISSNTQLGFNLSGTWQSNFGLSYVVINQFGNAITIKEVHPYYGITAVGEGVISQNIINVDYVNAFYSRGKGIIQVYNDRQMQGQFTLFGTGYTTSTTLYR